MTPPSDDLLTRWPWLAFIAIVLYLIRGALELSGSASKNLTGLTKVLSPAGRREQARDRRVVELEETLEIVDGQVERLLKQVGDLVGQLATQKEHLDIVHKLSDAQARAIRAHTAWDNQWLPRVRAALPNLDIPDPPDLYVYPEENP